MMLRYARVASDIGPIFLAATESSGGGLGGFFHGLPFKRYLIERERGAPVGSDA